MAETAAVVITTHYVWLCGQRMLRSLIAAGVLPHDACERRGEGRTLGLRQAALTPELTAAVTAHLGI